MLLILLPFSPILSFVFYLVSKKDSLLASWIEKNPICKISFSRSKKRDNISEFRQWMEEKLDKHIGFMYVIFISMI